MTAQNVVIQEDCVHLISDGAAIDTHGRLAHFMNKVTPHPHLCASVGVRGSRMLASVINDAIATGATSYDDMHRDIVAILRSHFDPARPIWEKKFGPNVMAAEIVVAGWSQSRGPHAFALATHNHNASHGLPAWKTIDLTGAFFSPSNKRLTADFARIQLEFNAGAAIALVEQQRSIKVQNVGGDAQYGVGGFVQVTTVREHSIESRVLKRWPDKIGSLIKPRMLSPRSTRQVR